MLIQNKSFSKNLLKIAVMFLEIIMIVSKGLSSESNHLWTQIENS